MTPEDTPPAFEGPHLINLDAQQDSKISSVSLYPGRAEITRVFHFAVKTGQNHIVIKSLPSVMDQESFRVDGHGKATIQGVSIFKTPAPVVPTSDTPEILALRTEGDRIDQALRRCDKSLKALERYLDAMHLSLVAPNQVGELLAQYDRESEQIEERKISLRQRQRLNGDKKDELTALPDAPNRQLNLQGTIGLFAPEAGEVTIVVIYAVISARWTPRYDIRVQVQDKEKPFTLVYQAGIAQNTGEDWTDTKVTLETITPSAGGTEPTLHPWRLWTEPVRPRRHRSRTPPPRIIHVGYNTAGPQVVRVGESSRRSRSPRREPQVIYAGEPSRRSRSPPPQIIHVGEPSRRSSRSPRRAPQVIYTGNPTPRPRSPAPPPALVVQGADFTAQGTISATYLIPGKISVPTDGQLHNVTVAQLELEAETSWVTVPKYDTKVYIKAKAKNISEFTLLEGQASVYVDNSFICRSRLPLVSPGQTFDCPLGIDRAIRITYHPRIQKTSQSGMVFTQKSSSQAYSQRVTVQNTKNVIIPRLKVLDQIPISEDSVINVKLNDPPLAMSASPSLGLGSLKGSKTSLDMKVRAQWTGADEETTAIDALGKDGLLEWLVSLEPQQTVNLNLDWEVTAPMGTSIHGL